MPKKLFSFPKVLSIFIFLFFSNQSYANEESVNLYSARKEALIKPALIQFYKQTGIKVKLLTGKADALLKRIELEGQNTPADLLLTTDAGNLYRANKVGVLQSYQSDILNKAIPQNLRDPDNFWYALSIRARPVFIAKESMLELGENFSYEDLADAKFKGKICVRSSNNIYNQSLLASIINANGLIGAENWASGLVGNFARPPQGGDRDQITAVANGQCEIAIANTYYYGQMLKGKDEKQRLAAEKVKIIWPNQSDRGAHINISGIAITRYAKNLNNAQKLIDFLAANEGVQKWFSEVNFEFSINPDIERSDLLKSWGDFKSDSINLSLLGIYNTEAIKIMDRVGWR